MDPQIRIGADVAKGALGPEQFEGGAHDLIGIDGDERILLRPCVVEEAADDAIDALHLARETSHDLGIAPASPQHFDIGPDRPQRVADLVGDAGGEAPDARQLLGAHELALRVEEPVRHPVQALGEHGEVAGVGVRRARLEVTVRDRIGRLHDAAQRAQDQPGDQRSPVQHEDAHFGGNENDHQHDAPLGRDRERKLRGGHTDEEGEGGEEGEIEQQLRAEPRLGAIHGTPR